MYANVIFNNLTLLFLLFLKPNICCDFVRSKRADSENFNLHKPSKKYWTLYKRNNRNTFPHTTFVQTV